MLHPCARREGWECRRQPRARAASPGRARRRAVRGGGSAILRASRRSAKRGIAKRERAKGWAPVARARVYAAPARGRWGSSQCDARKACAPPAPEWAHWGRGTISGAGIGASFPRVCTVWRARGEADARARRAAAVASCARLAIFYFLLFWVASCAPGRRLIDCVPGRYTEAMAGCVTLTASKRS